MREFLLMVFIKTMLLSAVAWCVVWLTVKLILNFQLDHIFQRLF